MKLNEIINIPTTEEYLNFLGAVDDKFDQRLTLLQEVNKVFNSNKLLSEMSVHERNLILGRNGAKEDIDTNLFGAPGGNGYVKSIISNKYKCFDDFFSKIPRLGKIDYHCFEQLLSLFKEALNKANIPDFAFALFTRILTVTRPDTFVSAASGALNPICKSLGIKQVGNNPDDYWNNLLIKLHRLPLFAQAIGKPHEGILAFIDSAIAQETKDKSEIEQGKQKRPSSTKNHNYDLPKPQPLNQILFGPPGTGKTYNTVDKALEIINPELLKDNKGVYSLLKTEFNALVEDGQIKFVTFHQSYGYEEFVEGIKPKTENEQVTYPLINGIFKNICIEAEKQPEKPFILIIDEINRGNISKIFGELITLIEESKRSGDDQTEAISLVLPSSGEPFTVPKNVYLIGTMNTADRSLTMMDTALRRRFEFVEMMPDASLLKGKEIKGIDLSLLLEKLNQRIEVLYDREHTLGHAFFMPVIDVLDDKGEDEAFVKLQKVFKNQIIPLLEEYFFEDWEKIQLVLGDNQKSESEQFIIKSNVNYSELFGANNPLSAHEQSSNSFALKPFNDNVWGNPEAFQQIYAPLNKEQTSESENA
jgi:5-methylcytosine-specific restriction protein B